MSIECGECERDLRGGHSSKCSRNPDNQPKSGEGQITINTPWHKMHPDHPSALPKLQKFINDWARRLMPNRVPADAIKKLSMEEVPELWRELKETGELSADELADIGIIWLDLCEMANLNPVKIMTDKMKINIKRRWKIEHGVLQHIDRPVCARCRGDHHVSDCDKE